ncbi:hypothetical protein R1flu_025548 [Riccia fluitans]|uniref:E3 ubiquitin-protein ligase n=1 Tax=Riccia fluitans TaxID=41844 RepID=A0ABD1Y154_9MARC
MSGREGRKERRENKNEEWILNVVKIGGLTKREKVTWVRRARKKLEVVEREGYAAHFAASILLQSPSYLTPGIIMEAAASPSSAATGAAESGPADSAASARTSPVEIVKKRLVNRGIPASYSERGPEGLIEYLKEDRSRVREVVAALFPDHDEIPESTPPADDAQASACRTGFLGMCVEAAYWIQWLMFERDPKDAFADTAVVNSAARGICGAVWGGNDIAYRCKTCEHDPTCAICVPCFKAGDHLGHDYSLIRTIGGCCDCGDVTAWKQSGFCINHRGPGHVPSLPLDFVASAGPVQEAVLKLWVLKLEKAIPKAEGKPKKWNSMSAEEKVASQTSLAIIKMLLELCCAGESMLSFTAKQVGRKDIGVLDALLKAESFMSKHVLDSLHELLYKLLGDSNFKLAFALVFISHYPRFIRESVADELENPSSNTFGSKHRDHAVLSNFSVQIFTVPTLTPKLVLEHKLLDMLMATLKEFLVVCAGDDGRLVVTKGPIIAELYIRVTEDIRYVMTHFEVSQYVIRERKDLWKAWLELLAFVQGMHPQKRVTSIHVEEENDDWDAGYHLEARMASIHPLFVNGAASAQGFHSVEGTTLSGLPNAGKDGTKDDDDDMMFVRHAKVGRISPKEANDVNIGNSSAADVEMADVASSSCAVADEYQCTESVFGVRSKDDRGTVQSAVAFPAHPLIWLISECVSILDRWLALDFSREHAKAPGKAIAENGSGPVRQHSGTLWRGRARGLTRGIARTIAAAEPAAPTATPPAVVEGEGGPGRGLREWLRRSRRPYAAIAILDEDRASTRAAALSGTDSSDMDVDVAGVSDAARSRDSTGTEWWMCTDDASLVSRLDHCTAADWPQLDFDVSRQDVSFHIPLHRILALLLRKVLELHSSNLDTSSPADRAQPDPWKSVKTLFQLLPVKYQVPGFAAILMEHPLRLQVLCAQVQAGMWRRNGHTITKICDVYRTVPWCEDTSELDMLVLQCCAVLAPPDKFVELIQSRFGLSDYFTLFLWRPNEYESSLAQEFLALLVRICTERGFCGLIEKESLRRELVQRLAVGDATHSSLIKALPRRLQSSKYLHEVLTAVANYRNPSGMQQGKYVLKEDCWNELDLYHPRWSPRELQFAEEGYIRTRKCSPVFQQIPRWRAPYAPLEQVGRFVVTEKVHDILHSVFYHAAFSSRPGDSRATEGLLFTALHLVSLGLDICSQASYKYVNDSSRTVTSSHEGVDCHLPHSESPNTSMFAVFSPQRSSTEEASEAPPLLTRSVQRLFVGGGGGGSAAGTTERQSLLSLLVILLRKYGSGESVMGTVVEANQYSAGDLVKSLLLKFAELNRGCMYEIESMVPEILHRPSAALNISSVSSLTVDKEAEDKQGVTDAEKRKAIARERQKAILEKMKAAQEKFLSSLQDESDESEKPESGSKEPKGVEEAGEGPSEDANSFLCALCRDTGSSSPLCFLTLLQKSRLLAIAQKPTHLWERPSARTGAPPTNRGSDTTRSASEVDSVEYTTADLWNWIQDALGDAATRERLLEGEAVLEVFRNGLHPGIRNTLRVANALGTPPARAVEAMETAEVEEPEGSGDNSEIEVCQDAVPLDTPNWWEEDPEPKGSDEWTSNRELNHVTVLAEYVAAVSRDRRRQGEREVPRNVELEVARELGGLRGRRVPVRNVTDANVATAFSMSDSSGVYLSACGHAVHQDCFDRYFGSLLQRYYSRALFEGVQIVDPDVGEFLCPVCRRLANCVVPVYSGKGVPDARNSECSTRIRMEVSSGGQEGSSSSASLQLHQALRLLLNAESLVNKPGFRKAVSTHLPDSIKGALDTLAVRLYGLYHPSTDHTSGQGALGRVPQSLHLWDVFRYTLMATELGARTKQSSTQGSLSSLVILEEGGEGSKGSILPLLLQIARASQGHSRQVVLLRSRGLQVLVDSIIHGVTRNLFLEQSPAGKYTSLQQYLEKSQEFGDVQFWKRVSDPILTHDPFSSLIWLLFCLPVPVPPVEGPFLALVHLFYMVCLTQVIAYHGIALSSDAEVGSSVPRFAAAVHSALSGAALSPLDDDSSVTHLCPSLDVIRQLTLPYLRQCFLLKKLLSGTGQVLPVARVQSWEISHRNPANIPGSAKDSTASRRYEDVENELEEVAQLEALFSIPPLTSLLTDENSLSVVLKWCHHVRASTGKELHIKAYIPRPVRATPFKLMELPHLFQDLLQRYVKERCLRCGNVPDRPALCLLCGTLVCAITSRPCACSRLNKQGECYRHAMACGAGVGVFLMLRRTTILLQRCERQANWPSPYLDAFGEEDLEQRGKPLYLSEERYASLAAMVASHGLDYSSLVLAQTTRQLLW